MMVMAPRLPRRRPTLSPVLQTNGAVEGKTFPLIVKMLKSFITNVLGREVPASIAHSLIKAKNRDRQHTQGTDFSDGR